jgi:hypothetical protein
MTRREQENPKVPAAIVDDDLHTAAEVAVKQGIGLDAFLAAAYAAYLRSEPDLAERLSDLALLAELEALRRSGRIGQA